MVAARSLRGEVGTRRPTFRLRVSGAALLSFAIIGWAVATSWVVSVFIGTPPSAFQRLSEWGLLIFSVLYSLSGMVYALWYLLKFRWLRAHPALKSSTQKVAFRRIALLIMAGLLIIILRTLEIRSFWEVLPILAGVACLELIAYPGTRYDHASSPQPSND
jgi:hypothetical protein